MSSRVDGHDLTIVIPTRERWPILRRTLAALDEQSVSGFTTLVVVDGEDQQVPDLGDRKVLVKPAGGSAAARNAGVAAVSTDLTMLLDDDMIPSRHLVERHLEHHASNPTPEVGVLGRVVWHPELPSTRVGRWIDWSNLMFDYDRLRTIPPGAEVGWGRFYSCNVSFKTQLFRDVGGFDETFLHYYEDTDLAKRLGDAGLRLRYEPRALTHHLQQFDWQSVQHRFDRVAVGERLMVEKHPDFRPWYRPQMEEALVEPGRSRMWTYVVDYVPRPVARLRRAAEFRANRVYLRELAPSYLANFDRAVVVVDLMRYLGPEYEPFRLVQARAGAPDEARSLYGAAAAELAGQHEQTIDLARDHARPGAEVLSVGGAGGVALALRADGMRVTHVDDAGSLLDFARWRIESRGAHVDVTSFDELGDRRFDLAIWSGRPDRAGVLEGLRHIVDDVWGVEAGARA